jgi:hypothetical protein
VATISYVATREAPMVAVAKSWRREQSLVVASKAAQRTDHK